MAEMGIRIQEMEVETGKPNMRYYAQLTTPEKYWMVNWLGVWLIYDRNRLSPQGEIEGIALCANRQTAMKIVDALNNYKELENE